MTFRAKYLGDHDRFSAWGIRFPRGVFVPVTDPHAQAKISGNSHFEVEQSDAEDVEFTETPMGESVAEAPGADADAPEGCETEAADDVAEDAGAMAEGDQAAFDAPEGRQKRQYTRRK